MMGTSRICYYITITQIFTQWYKGLFLTALLCVVTETISNISKTVSQTFFVKTFELTIILSSLQWIYFCFTIMQCSCRVSTKISSIVAAASGDMAISYPHTGILRSCVVIDSFYIVEIFISRLSKTLCKQTKILKNKHAVRYRIVVKIDC